MKNINDDRLRNVEKFVRDNGPEIIEQKLKNESNFAFTREQMLIDIFGHTYNTAPEKFCFRDGDRMLIKELVEHVKKIVDENGINSGLHQFKMKVKKPRQYRSKKPLKNITQSIDNESDIENDNIANTDNLVEMKTNLLHKVEECLVNYRANKLADIGNLDDENVHVTVANGQTYGNITCVICRNNKKSKKKKTNRVFYSSAKNCWVMSNFVKHLTTYHRLSANRDSTKQKNLKVDNVSILRSADSLTDEKKHLNESDDVYIIEEIEVDIKKSESDKTPELNSDGMGMALFQQVANQIGQMVGAVLLNDDQQEQLRFIQNDGVAELTVAKILGDGNCLLYAIVHQMYRMAINSNEHKAATTKLRRDIVEHILCPDNFEAFRFSLQDRVYEMKTKDEIIDMVADSKHFVQNVLSMDGCWAGHECIVAASRIFSVNIIIVEEGGTSYLANHGEIFYNRSIVVAYRIGGRNGNQIIRNHYDSVSDISSDNIYKATSLIESRMNKKK